MNTRRAAQYIRMSTDRQDLSPVVQRETIAAYATAQGMEVVETYEDDGRSGVRLKNRPALLKLLHDVTGTKQFDVVLVYDVSRWGRFQDTDAAAYYEYHCRLNGVEVIYVAELFGAELNPITAMLKSIKRAMAAEYSRDLANKSRAGQRQAVARGFQLGALPPLGYRRCSVSADGSRRVLLERGQRKLAATDRIEWVLASQAEHDLTKRICHLYAYSGLSFVDIAEIGTREGWRDHAGRRVSRRSVATLLKNEALIGNFVWGRSPPAKSLVKCAPSRNDGCVARLIDDETWARIQRRTAQAMSRKITKERLVEKLRGALERNPLLATRDLKAHGLPGKRVIRAHLGSWAQFMSEAGRDADEDRKALIERAKARRACAQSFGAALAERLVANSQEVKFDGHLHTLDWPNLSVGLRLLWPNIGELGESWRIRIDKMRSNVDLVLLVRMKDLSVAKDYFVAPPADALMRLPQLLVDPVPSEISRFWCQTPAQLVQRFKEVSERGN